MTTQEQIKHTPGPWKIGFSDGSGAGPDGYSITAGDHPAIRRNNNTVMVVRSYRDEWGVVQGIDNEANAKLIASAPDLYAACEKWLNTYDSFVRQDAIGDEPGIAEMRAAVAKARGAK